MDSNDFENFMRKEFPNGLNDPGLFTESANRYLKPAIVAGALLLSVALFRSGVDTGQPNTILNPQPIPDTQLEPELPSESHSGYPVGTNPTLPYGQ